MNRLARLPARWIALVTVIGLTLLTGCTTNKYYGDRDRRDHDRYHDDGHGHRYAYDRGRGYDRHWDR